MHKDTGRATGRLDNHGAVFWPNEFEDISGHFFADGLSRLVNASARYRLVHIRITGRENLGAFDSEPTDTVRHHFCLTCKTISVHRLHLPMNFRQTVRLPVSYEIGIAQHKK